MDLNLEIAEGFAQAGVRRAFTVASAHSLKVLDALTQVGIEITPARSELVAGHMADGYARVAGEWTLLVTSTGPGAGNALGAMATAGKDCSKVVHVTTSNQAEDGRAQAVHYVPEQGAWLSSNSSPLIDFGGADTQDLLDAFSAAEGPFSVVVPFRLERRTPLMRWIPERPISNGPRLASDLSEALAMWLGAERRLLWIGGGARELGLERLAKFAERSAAAVVTTIQGKDLFPSDHPHFVGCTLQSDAVKQIVQRAEACLALGSRMADLSTANWDPAFPKKLVRVAHSDEHPPWSGIDHRHVDMDVETAMASIETLLGPSATHSFGRDVGLLAAQGRYQIDRSTPEYQILDAITANLGPDDVLSCDMTKLSFWTIGGLQLPAGARYLFPGLLTMGFGMPSGVGASWARPSSRVIVLTGDGGLLSVLPGIDDARGCPGRLDIVLVDDDGYGLLRPQASDSVAKDLCTFSGPAWEPLISSFGISYVSVSTPDELSEKLAIHSTGPRVLHVDGTKLAMGDWRQA